MMRDYYIQYNVGTCKYVLNYHDGEKTHADGSAFYDCAIFSNKRKLTARVRLLKRAGHQERAR